ncbi:helix-turn-helix domain-containing protein [Chitinophaga oryziterrae]|uniref:Helix-turn-helix domain-containing protein n=1 Tax=Chitinophaga oryziterrae TaxID=1031224 RepID=A0A6N8JC35_9BACT|nr:helix-turn-helix transcriptional regulator [Chitinophaga oryziterrae]MVT41682.1 helix-turn-helix domain-containing protein [Chitinophaga oryziterrae]
MNNSNLNKLISKETSQWKEKAQKRISERDWKSNSRAVALTVLTQLRIRSLSQTELAGMMGVSRQQVSKIVKGQENLTFETISKLEKALGITIIKISNILTEENGTKIQLPSVKIKPQVMLYMPVFSPKVKQNESPVELPQKNGFTTFSA